MATKDSLKALGDEQLLQQYKLTAKQDLLAELYLRYAELVYGLCVKYLKDQDLAKDAVMGVYEELTRKAMKHEVTNFKGWLYMMAKNYCLMQLRSDKKLSFVEMQEDFVQFEENEHLSEIIIKEDSLNKLEFCIEQLNEEQQKSIRLFYLEEKCYQEITEITGLEWNKVRSLIQNGKRNLKICMDKNEQ